MPPVWGVPPDAPSNTPGEARAESPAASAPGAFSAQAEALPFPRDAREVEFDATFKDIEFTSGSSLGSLTAFYRQELLKRGWTEDETAAANDEDSIEMTFKHDNAQVVIELDVSSDGVDVGLDCEGLDFGQTSDPAALIAAGVPQPRSYVFLQQEIPRPKEIQDVEYQSDACHFKSSLALQAAFDFYTKGLEGLGWRETRRPIITGDRRYTEFKRGPVELSVNVFSHEVGSRIILGYENETKEPIVPPLPAVASASPTEMVPGASGDASPESPERVAVDVSKNTGSATVTLGSKKYVFKHVAAYRTKDDGDEKTRLVFCERAIPLQRLQALLAKDDSFSFGDLYELDYPGHLTIEWSEHPSFFFNAGGVGIGDSLDDPASDLKVENGRVHGAIKMREPQEVFDESFQLAASIDAGVMTLSTRLGASPAQPAIAARQSPFPASELLLPEGCGNIQSEGTQYCKSTQAEVDLALKAVAEFYRKELAAQGWNEEANPSSAPARIDETTTKATLLFKKPTGSMTIKLTSEKQRTLLDVAFHDDAKAKQDGMLPEPGKARIVMVNGYTKDVVIMIGKRSYPLKAGQGTIDPKTALNYSVAPGKYELTIKIPGEPPQAESLEVAVGASWGVFTLPTGDYLTNRLYWSAATAANTPAVK